MWCELLHGEVGGVIVAKHADPGSSLPSQQHLLHHLIYRFFECMFDNLSKHLRTDTVKAAWSLTTPSALQIDDGRHYQRDCLTIRLEFGSRTAEIAE